MNKTLIIALAALPLAAAPVLAADSSNTTTTDGTQMQNESSMKPTAGQGAPSNQEPGTPTSSRSNDNNATTPPNQVDRNQSGETSDRTPGNHAK